MYRKRFITQDEPCENDYLEVIPTSADSLPTNSTKKYCGEYLADQPLIINSESNVLKLRFKSDNLFRYRGFKCRYRAMHPNGVAVINTYLSGEETNGEITIQCLDFCTFGRDSADRMKKYVRYDICQSRKSSASTALRQKLF